MASIAPEMHAIQGSSHDEVYLALKPLTNLMRIHGMFPIANIFIHKVNDQSVNQNSKIVWGLTWLFLIILTLCGITAVWYGVAFDYAASTTDPVEGFVLSMSATMMCLGCFMNLFTMLAQGPKWAAYFEQWKRTDGLFGITMDQKLRSYVKKVFRAYVIYVSMAVGTALSAVVQKFVSPDEDYTGNSFAVSLICYSIIANGCLLLPEIFFVSLLKAISLRFSILIEKFQRIVDRRSSGSDTHEIRHELEESRIAFSSLMDIVKSTDAFTGPILASCVFISTTYLSSTFFFIFFQSLDNLGVLFAKAVYSSVSLFRLMYICFAADAINRKMMQLKRVIYLIPSDKLSLPTESFNELMLLIQYTKKTSVTFTVWNFFDINKELLNKVVGAILTYTLTILEFYGKQNNYYIDCPDEVINP